MHNLIPFRLVFLFILSNLIGLGALTQFPITAYGAETAYIPVGSARTKKSVVAFPSIRTQDSASSPIQKIISDTVQNDLSYMDMFKLMNSAAYIENTSSTGITLGSFPFKDWTSIGADFLIKSSLTVKPDRRLVLETHVYDTSAAKEIFTKKYYATSGEAKATAHQFANDIVETLTGLPGIFLTKIAMTCDKTRKKEIYVMNYDGTESRQLTSHRSLAFGPAWSPDGTRIAYSLFTKHRDNIKNIDLVEYNFLNRTMRMISSRKGINSGPAYSPDGTKLAATLSFAGNPELYLINLATLAPTKVTHSFGFDVDPSWNPDGTSLAFVSSRTGNPMIFSMKVEGKDAQRLTYAGKYNATPSWSPQNNKIAFAGWLEKHFDIFIMNPDGTNIERLTKGQGNNEDPHFSPDGNFIVFSSNRTGKKEIYAMNIDGSFVRRLTYGLGNCTSPKWSNPPKLLSQAAVD